MDKADYQHIEFMIHKALFNFVGGTDEQLKKMMNYVEAQDYSKDPEVIKRENDQLVAGMVAEIRSRRRAALS